MPATFKLISEKKLVHTRLRGPVNLKNLLKHIQEVEAAFASGKLDSTWRQLVQIEDMAYIGSSPRETVQILAEKNPWPPSCRRVILCTQNYYTGLAGMYLDLVDPEKTHTLICGQTEEAFAFLNR